MTTPRDDAREMVKGMLREIAEQNDEIERLRTERDALRAAIDRHVASVVAEKYYVAPSWVIMYRAEVEAYYTREKAEAAYRKSAGLDVPAVDATTKEAD